MTVANIVLSAKDNTRAAFATLEGSVSGAGKRLDALNGTVKNFFALAAVAGFTASLSSAINELDRLGDTAPKIGLTSQSLAELGFAAKLSGADTATLEGAIGKLSTRMADAAGGSKEAAAVFKSLGINVKDAAGNLKGGDIVLGEIADKFATFTDGPERAALAVEIFGKSGRELIPLLIQGSKGIDGLRSEFRALAGDDLTAAAQAASVFNDNLDRLQASTGKFSREIIEATLPALNGLVTGFIDTKKGIEEVNPVAEALATILETVSVVGANVAFVLKSVRDNIGGYAALIFASAELKDSIYESIKADDEARRRQLDNFEKRILGARSLANEIAKIDKSYQALEDRRLKTGGPEKVSAPVINKPAAEAQSAYKSISAELEKQVKLLAAQSELGRNLTDGEKFRIEINEKINSEATKLTASERAALLVQAEKVAALKDEEDRRQKNVKLAQQAYADQLEFQEDITRAEREAEAARQSTRTYVRDIVSATEEQARLLTLEASLVNATDQQRAFALEKLRIELQLRKDILEVERRLQFDAVAQQEAIDQLNADARIKIANAQNRSILDEFNKTTVQISDSLTDALLRGFESGKGFVRNFVDTLKNLFKTLVLTPTIKAIIQPVAGALTGALGIAGPASADTGGGGIGSLLSLGSNLSTVYSAITGGLTSTVASFGTSVAQGFASLGLDSAATAVATFTNSLTAASAASAAGTAAAGGAAAGSAAAGSSLYASAAAAGPYVVAALAVLNALGVFRSKKIVDGGLSGELGGQVNDYALQRRGGTLFSGPSYSVQDRGVSGINQALQDSYNAIRGTVAGMAEQLGIGSDAIKTFTVRLGNDLIHPDTGGFGIKTQGLSQDEIVKKIEAALLSANEQLAAFALGTTEYTRQNETAVATLSRLTGSLQLVNGTFKTLGLTLADASLVSADAASKFLDSFGGADQFAQVASSYYQNFYTEAERTAKTVEGLRQRFFELGVNGATTRAEFRALVEEQQRLHGAASPVVAELLKLESTFASVVPATDAVTLSIEQMAQAQIAAAAAVEQSNIAFERAGALAAQRAREADLENRKIESNDRRNAAGGTLDNAFRGGLDVFIQQFGTAQEQAQRIIPEWLTSLDQIDFLFTRNLISEDTMTQWQQALTTVRNAQTLAAGALTDTVRAYTQAFEQTQAAGVATGGVTSIYQNEAIRLVGSTLAIVSESSADAAQKLEFLTGTLQQLDVLGLGASESADHLKQAIAELTPATEAFTQDLAQREQLERQLLELQGDTAALRALDRAKIIESNLSVYDRIVAIQDEQKAVAEAALAGQARAEAERLAAAEVERVSQIRLGLENRLLQLQGNVNELRIRELAGLPESAKAIQQQIYALEDMADAAQSAATASQVAAQAEQDLQAERLRVANERLGIESELLQLLGNTAELRRRELAALDPTNRALKEQVFALQDLKAANEAVAKAEIERINSAANAQKKLLQAQVSAAQDALSQLNGIFGSLQSALKATQVETDAVSRVRQAQARDLLAQAVTATSQGQSITGIAGLQDALDVVSQQQPQLYRTFDEFLAAQDSAASLIGQLGNNTQGQISVAELTLKAAQDNIAAIEASTQSIVDAIEQGTAATAALGGALGVSIAAPVAFTPPSVVGGGNSNLEALVVSLTTEVTALKAELQQIKTNTAVGARVLQGAYGPDGTNPVLMEIAE